MKLKVLALSRMRDRTLNIIFASILAALLSSCISSPSNDKGRAFDADSAYCVQLRQKITNPYQDMDTFDHDTDTQKVVVEDMGTSMSKTDNMIALYSKDCESLAAFNARKKKNEFTFGEPKNNGGNGR
jgi:hypothetical protein